MMNHKPYVRHTTQFPDRRIVWCQIRPCATRLAPPSANSDLGVNLRKISLPQVSLPLAGTVNTSPKRVLTEPPFVRRGAAGCAA